jgi:hypothetical protein
LKGENFKMAQKIFTDESLTTFVDETKAYVENAVSTKADKNHTHAIEDIPKLPSIIGNIDLNFAALDELKANKEHTHSQYLTQHQDLSSYAKKSEIPTDYVTSTTFNSHKSDATHITSAERTTWNGKSNFSGNYNDLTDKPTTLPNPNALTITLGSTKYTYDGSKAVSVTIQDGNGVSY